MSSCAALIALGVSALFAGIQMAASQILRGKSIPDDMRFYISHFTSVFLLFRIPGVWNRIGFTRPWTSGSSGTGAGFAIFLATAMVLTVHLWVAPTYTFGGFNFTDVWHTQLITVGGLWCCQNA